MTSLLQKTQKKSIFWNKPAHVGAAILNVWKLQMYQFHFEEMVPMYGKNARVFYKDTDSIFYYIEIEDVYKNLKGMKNLLHLKSYPQDPTFIQQPKQKFLYN